MSPWQAGTRLGPYVLVAHIGQGGMGEVWKARDTRLDRVVAIKRLKSEHSARFEQEARAVAALNHPNICTLHDIGPDYLVMEYIEGAPLKGPLPVTDAVKLATQIAEALVEAHARGILHRDLKPANILVTAKASVKLLDFGLAKLTLNSDATQTLAGAVMGTPLYMAPEQAEGQPADARSDVFSFGAVLYEMLTGHRAFDSLASVLRDDPQPPPALANVVMRCLAKRPADRFQSIAEVKAALERATQAEGPSRQPPSIAVLPFANMSRDPDDEYFSDGLAEEIINALTHVPGLKVIARTSAFAFKGKHEDVRKIAEALGVANILEGSVRRAGNRIRVTAQLITAADGSHLWSERYDREMADVFAIQDEISQAIAMALQVKLSGKPHYIPKLAAYEALLRGRHHLFKFSPESWNRANECFEQAVALDPGYAQPYADLGLSHFLTAANGLQQLREVVPTIRAAARKALELNPSELGPRFLLGSIAAAHDYNWEEAAEHFRAALSTTPVAAHARWAYASLYLQPFARFGEAVAEMQREVEQDPLNVTWRSVLSSHMTHAGMLDRAIEESGKALDLDPHSWVAYFNRAEAYAAAGRLTEAVEAAERAHRLAPWSALAGGALAGVLKRLGNTDRAADVVQQLGGSQRAVIGRVLYHLLCLEPDEAAGWYEKLIEQRDPFALIFAAAPVNQVLRDSPHWPRLARMMNLPEGR